MNAPATNADSSATANVPVLLEDVRVRWAHLVEPRKSARFPDQPPAYDLTVLLPKDSSQFAVLRDAIWGAMQARYGEQAATQWSGVKLFRDGDVAHGRRTTPDEASRGHWQVTVKNQDAVPVVDHTLAQLDPKRIYPGCHVNVRVHAFWNRAGTLSVWLDGVQFFRNGTPFAGGAPTVGEMFTAQAAGEAPQSTSLAGAAPSAPAPAPAPAAAPVPGGVGGAPPAPEATPSAPPPAAQPAQVAPPPGAAPAPQPAAAPVATATAPAPAAPAPAAPAPATPAMPPAFDPNSA